jgi:hypothetical protein
LIINEFPLLEGHRSIDADITIGGEGSVLTDVPDPHVVQNSGGSDNKMWSLNCKFHGSRYVTNEVNIR